MTLLQPSLFAEFEDEILTERHMFCIKHKYNSDFMVEFSVDQNEEPEHEALTKLGYFVVTTP